MKHSILRPISRLSIAALLTTAAFNVSAQTDGTLGNTSSGSTDLTLTKGELVQITKIDLVDWLFGSTPVVGNQDIFDQVCVFSSATGGAYSVTLTSPNFAGGFRVVDGVNAVPYTIQWNDGTTATAMNTQALTAGFVGDDTNQDCGSAAATNATIRYRVTAANVNAAPVGTYTDTLTLTISPN